MKQTRARSPEMKEKQLERILNAGRELFLSNSETFSMRQLARQLEMSQGNLYNYVSSKRELWFAVVNRDFKDFENGMKSTIDSHSGPQLELLDKLADGYFTFAMEDTQRYRMMFSSPPKASSSTGPYETTHEPDSLSFIIMIIETAIEKREIIETEPGKLAFYFWSVLHGVILNYLENCENESITIPLGDFKDFQKYVRNKLIAPYRK